MSSEPTLRVNDAALQIFQQIAEEMKEIRADTRDLRERMIRFETLDFVKKIDKLEDKNAELTEDIQDLKEKTASEVSNLKLEISTLKTKVAPVFTAIVVVATLVGNYLIRVLAN